MHILDLAVQHAHALQSWCVHVFDCVVNAKFGPSYRDLSNWKRKIKKMLALSIHRHIKPVNQDVTNYNENDILR